MIDHVLGRPSTKFRKIQVSIVVLFWSSYLLRGSKHGPPAIRTLSAWLSRKLTVWQTTVIIFLWLYICRNFAKVVGLECPEPLANLYSRSFFRATWITTALDAGFWTAMKIKPKWLRDIASLTFTVYYLFAAEQADEKVRRIRATLTVDHLRVSWNKATSPYLWRLAGLVRPRFTKYSPCALRIPRPSQSVYKEPVSAWLYFDGPLSALQDQTCMVLDIPGGGFIAMSPRTSEDRLLAWAGKTKVPILSLDYKKAPEYPYPYALNECYDAYHTIVATRGRCLGLSGHTRPRIVLTGDSAGGNLAAGLTLMVLQTGSTDSRRWQNEDVLPQPDGLVLTYPALNVKVESWMTEEQMALILDRSTRKMNHKVLEEKSKYYNRLTPSATPGPSDESLHDPQSGHGYFDQKRSKSARESPSAMMEKSESNNTIVNRTTALSENQLKNTSIQTRLAISSVMAYTNDRILTPEMMRAMIILYIGPYNRPDFSTDFLLSPVLAPEALLARFPKTYFLTGERDPLVDDTVIFAGRLRQAKLHQFRERQELGLEKSHKTFQEKDHVEVSLIPAISHGFLQMAGFFPEAWKHINRCANWIQNLFVMVENEKSSSPALLRSSQGVGIARGRSKQDTTILGSATGRSKPILRSGTPAPLERNLTGESSGDEEEPLEMGIGTATSVSPFKQPSNQESPYPNNSMKTNMNESGDTQEPEENTHQNSNNNNTNEQTHSFPKNLNDPRENKKLPPAPSPTSTTTNNQNKTKMFPKSQKRRRRELMKSIKLSLLQDSPEEHDDDDAAIADDDKENDDDVLYKALRTGFRKREKSLTSLPSEEDLLGRRMEGFAGVLNGVGEEARTP